MPAMPEHKIIPFLIATRLPFLSVTLVAVLLGWASATWDGVSIHALNATLTLLFALVAHAGGNVVNDYYDALNGCDSAESDRITPFTGGSRMIQNGILSQKAIGVFGYALLASVIPVGVWLTHQSGSGLLLIGLVGLLCAWAYSAPPLKLQSRGLGELGIISGWLMVVVGTDFVQRHAFSSTPLVTGLGLAFLIANILYINQFPDIRADRIAHKYTAIVRLGLLRARWGYLVLLLAGYGWLVLMVAWQHLPLSALLALAPIGLSLLAFIELWRNAHQPAQLSKAIRLTILAALLHGVILNLVLLFSHNSAR